MNDFEPKEYVCIDKKYVELLREIAECGAEDPPSYLCRNDYVLVEVENELWKRIQEATK
jgi:hypothetical protein